MNLSASHNPGNRETTCAVVFDRGRSQAANPELMQSGLLIQSGSLFGAFRRTWRDRPGTSVTAKLLGDPAPGRAVPVTPPEDRPSAPVYLTFRDYEVAYALGQ